MRMYSCTRSYWAREIWGPWKVEGAKGSPITLILETWARKAATKDS
jgi:hypothetical protein